MRISSIGTLSLLVLSTLGARGLARVDVQSFPDKTVYEVTVEGVDFTPVEIEGKPFTQASLKGVSGYEGVKAEVGKPEIPVIRFYIDGEGPIQVEADGHSTQALENLTNQIRPTILPTPKTPGAKNRLVIDQKFYETRNLGQPSSFEISEVGSVRGKRRRLVTLFAFQYDPASAAGLLISHFRVTFRPDSSTFAVSAPSDETFAFVVGKNFADSPALRRYRTFKEGLGYHIETIEVGKDAMDPPGIRAKLRALYQKPGHPLKHALLIGRNTDVPGFVSPVLSAVTDHYYRCLDTDVYENDVATPDIGVGRIAVQNEAQLAAVVDKYIRYERGVFTREDWLQRLSFIASDDPDFWEVAEGTHNYVIDQYTKGRGYTGDFPSLLEPGGDKLFAITHRVTAADVVDRIRKGRAIINYGGHGDPEEWVSPHLTIADVESLKDNGSIPWVMANACNTAQFTAANSIGETWQRQPFGAVLYLGSMTLTDWDEDDIFQRKMYDGIFQNGLSEFASMTAFAMQEVWRYYGGAGQSRYYFETYVTLGDPSMRLRTWMTRSVTLVGSTQVPQGTREVSYQLIDENHVPVRGARVALSSMADYHRAATTDLDGKVTLPLGRGTRFTISVTGDNLKLLTQELLVEGRLSGR